MKLVVNELEKRSNLKAFTTSNGIYLRGQKRPIFVPYLSGEGYETDYNTLEEAEEKREAHIQKRIYEGTPFSLEF